MSSVFPLNNRQQLFFLEDSIHPSIPTNNVILTLSIHSSIDTVAFLKAFSDVVKQTEALNLALTTYKSGLGLTFLPPVNFIDFVDFTTKRKPVLKLNNWLEKKSLKTFKQNETLFEAALLKLNKKHFLFYLNQHHIITDGHSCHLIIKQLDKLYQFYSNSSPTKNSATPAGLAIVPNFSDYLIHVNNLVSSKGYENNLKYWKEKFSTPPSHLNFYGNRLPKTAKTVRLSQKLCLATSEKIHDQTDQIPHSRFFLTILFAYLHRVTTSDDILIGIPLLNRQKEYLNTPGLFMEICPNRIQFSKDESFYSLTQKLKEENFSVKPYKDFISSTDIPDYDVIFNFREAFSGIFANKSADLDITTPLNILPKSSIISGPDSNWEKRESLRVIIDQSKTTPVFTLHFDFNIGVWPDDDLRHRAIAHFSSLISHCLEYPKRPIGNFNILTDHERNLLFPPIERLDTYQKKPSQISTSFFINTKLYPDRIALITDSEKISYAELAEQVSGLALYLSASSFRVNDKIGIFLDRNRFIVSALLACNYLGLTYIPIDPNFPEKRIHTILDDSKPAAILTVKTLRKKISSLYTGKILCLDNIQCDTLDKTPVPESSKSDLAYIIYTSGSTGKPKGVQISNDNLSTFLSAMAKKPGMSKDNTLLAVTTISFDISALELFLPLLVGGCIRLASETDTKDGKKLARIIDEENISILQATPATFRLLLASNWKGNHQLSIFCGGEAFPPDLAQKLVSITSSVWNMYGPTETTVWSSVSQILPNEQIISLGSAIQGTRLFVLNNHLSPVPVGVPGELYITGDGVGKGYLNRPELTKERFISDPFSNIPETIMYKTGDMVRFDFNNRLIYLGRNDHQVKIRGYRIELGEIESTLMENKNIKVAAVLARLDYSNEMSLVAYLVPEETEPSLDITPLRQDISSKLPSYMVPAQFIILEEIPLTPNGKIDRKQLPEVDISLPKKKLSHPRNDFEIALCTVWEKCLNTSPIGIDDSFFDLGGHSLLAASVITEMIKATGTDFGMGLLFHLPTIREISDKLNDQQKSETSAVVPLQPNGNSPPLFLLSGIEIYRELANQFDQGQPVLGIYVPEEHALIVNASNGMDSSISIPSLAKKYCDAILRYAPSGPYQLGGISFGGMLAVEVAKLLKQKNKEVGAVILLDTILRKGKQVNWLINHSLVFLRPIIQFFQNTFMRKTDKQSMTSNSGNDHKIQSAINTRETVLLQGIDYYENSKISAFDGDIILLKAMDKSKYARHVKFLHDYGWSHHVTGKVIVYQIPGDHLGILKGDNAVIVASTINNHLNTH